MDYEIVIIGAGVIGLAIGRELAGRGHEVVIIEEKERYGTVMSSRNSEVIHAGIYYPQGSLKSDLCIRGKIQLYSYLEKQKLPHLKCGKIIVATTNKEIEELREIEEKAGQLKNVPLQWLSAKELKRKEPNVEGLAGLFSPSTGIIDVHSYMDALVGDLRQAGGEIVTQTSLAEIKRMPQGYKLKVTVSSGAEILSCKWVINAAGLNADKIAAGAGIDIDKAGYRLHWCKGNYFRLSDRPEYRLKHLIYPVPRKQLAGLGIHATIDLAGGVKFGPDVNYMDVQVEEYGLETDRAGEFHRAISKYMPQIRSEHLFPDMSGIRGKLQGPGEPFRDFIIKEEKEKGLPCLINLIGIESPGFTASLAVAEYVSRLVD